jgi:NAD(P)-dependent dehydrogenase (short-subunit alcohol dehydrogenase family)
VDREHRRARADRRQLTKNLTCEWAKDNIRTNSAVPWYIRTSLTNVGKDFSLWFMLQVCTIFCFMVPQFFFKNSIFTNQI